jgi:hypothetical protein
MYVLTSAPVLLPWQNYDRDKNKDDGDLPIPLRKRGYDRKIKKSTCTYNPGVARMVRVVL